MYFSFIVLIIRSIPNETLNICSQTHDNKYQYEEVFVCLPNPSIHQFPFLLFPQLSASHGSLFFRKILISLEWLNFNILFSLHSFFLLLYRMKKTLIFCCFLGGLVPPLYVPVCLDSRNSCFQKYGIIEL